MPSLTTLLFSACHLGYALSPAYLSLPYKELELQLPGLAAACAAHAGMAAVAGQAGPAAASPAALTGSPLIPIPHFYLIKTHYSTITINTHIIIF